MVYPHRFVGVLTVSVVVVCHAMPIAAQQVQLTSPFQQLNDSYYENFGLGWGARGSGRNGNWFFNRGPATSTPPQFGGYDPGADATFGFGGRAGGIDFNFNGLAGQGSTRSNVVQAPTIVVPNGGTGSMFSGSVRPFVTGVIPVVGGAPMMPVATSISPLALALQRMQQEGGYTPTPHEAEVPATAPAVASEDAPLVMGRSSSESGGVGTDTGGGHSGYSTASHGDLSVAEIKRRQAAEDAVAEQDILVRIEKARGYEEAGKLSIAKMYYQQAATRADGELKERLLRKIRSLNK